MIYILNQENNEGYEFLALQCLVGMLVFLKQSNNYTNSLGTNFTSFLESIALNKVYKS